MCYFHYESWLSFPPSQVCIYIYLLQSSDVVASVLLLETLFPASVWLCLFDYAWTFVWWQVGLSYNPQPPAGAVHADVNLCLGSASAPLRVSPFHLTWSARLRAFRPVCLACLCMPHCPPPCILTCLPAWVCQWVMLLPERAPCA